MTRFPKWSRNVKIQSQRSLSTRYQLYYICFNGLCKPIEKYIYASKKHPFTSYPATKQQKHSKFFKNSWGFLTLITGFPHASSKFGEDQVRAVDLRARLAAGEDLLLLDVRDPDEFEKASIEGARPTTTTAWSSSNWETAPSTTRRSPWTSWCRRAPSTMPRI